MPSHTFTPDAPIIRQTLTPPPGATALVVNFTVTRPAGAGTNVRLAHLRTLNSVLHPNLPAEGRLPRESEICELIVRNGGLTAGFSGYGGRTAKNPPKHMGGVPQSFPVTLTVPFNGKAAVVAAGSLVAASDTDIAPNGQPLELVLGMEPIVGADLQPPYGWTIAWDADAVTWPGASAPGISPGVPPVIPTPPLPPELPAPGDPRDAAIEAALALLAPHVSAQQLLAARLILGLSIGAKGAV